MNARENYWLQHTTPAHMSTATALVTYKDKQEVVTSEYCHAQDRHGTYEIFVTCSQKNDV